MISSKDKSLILGLIFLSACSQESKIGNIEDAMNYLLSKRNHTVRVDEMIGHLSYQDIDTFTNRDGTITYNLLFSNQHGFKDTCFLIIEYSQLEKHIIDCYKSCQ